MHTFDSIVCRRVLRLVLSSLLVACAESSPHPRDEPLADSDGEQALDSGSPDAASAACEEGVQRACWCSSTSMGAQTCVQGRFAACEECAEVVDVQSKCIAGTYRGNFKGSYRSEPSGLCGATAGAEEQLDFDVVFTLVEVGVEFYEVRATCLRVPGEEQLSSETDSAYGLTFELSGIVDCATGEADFLWQGSYMSTSVCSLGVGWDRYFTKGFVKGTFDPATRSFVDTSWELRERPPLFGGPTTGGSGTFTATLDEDAGVPDTASGADCLGVEFPEDLTPQPVPSPR